MGGTGKSRVIQALINFFNARKESHRFIVLAPTGTAAALLNGSTYHSVLGILSRLDGDEKVRNEGRLVMDAQERLFGLPPTNRNYLYGDFEKPEVLAKLSKQHSAIVVILTQNMRQRTQSKEDSKLRTALENIIIDSKSELILQDLNYRNTSIITSFNGKKRKQHSKDSDHDMMTEDLQKSLWKLEPISSDHVPGTLSLCIELCITRGQEAVVVGWDSGIGSYQSMTLETLFVKLINPLKTANINGLPENVVPIPKNQKQVNVLPNFAMTDYSSQGKTRQYNINIRLLTKRISGS
ncbi:hypothetical protein FA15DRAFT_680755 [Coprinopsis marcescibilis]|uniref:Uncharacterized protein n=1 Tax=Coprinopsis marcescibilis TaxID=230819 RepID=A0A5C3KV38_COPMA|nr:hypothetical protein FA15DRAFT_680755 [Coprinopsis marcescibilis]